MKLLRTRLDRNDLAELSALRGSRADVLALARGDGVVVVGLRDALAARDTDGWLVHGYHTIERGGWDPTASRLWWQRIDGVRTELGLDDPGRLPELFRERMTASVIADHVVTVGSESVRIVARRDLADPSSALIWTASPAGGVPRSESMNRLLDDALAWVKADYAFA